MLTILHYDFMIRAFVAGISIALVAPVIGQFLVVRRYSLMADTLAHVSLLGVALGIFLNINTMVTSLVVAVASAFGIERLQSGKKIYGESALALFLTGSLALATVIISAARGFNANLLSYLFGSITTVSQADMYLILGLCFVILLAVSLWYQPFFAISLDEELATVNGLPARWLGILMTILAAFTIALALRIVGVLLIGALMVIPVLTALQFKRGFQTTMLLGIIFSLLSVILGLLASYYFNLASGGTIVVVALILFSLSLLLSPHD